ncbi:AI-2E family transporter [Oleiharenicola lentus]|uniref:AI-2E family transporter n=1 Tax=Oleiharenicola lentus TaxID=2508720 RepID=UPI003F6624E2
MKSPTTTSRTWPELPRFVAYVAVTLALSSLFVLAWGLREILLLTFGAIVFAAIIRAVAQPVIKRFPEREKLAVFGAILALLAGLSGLFWLFGHQIAEQMRGFMDRLPEAINAAKAWLEQHAAGRLVMEKIRSSHAVTSNMDNLSKVAAVTLESLGHLLLMLVVAIYLALTPRLYVSGFARLFPLTQRQKIHDAFEASGDSLQKWLLGQLISMLTIGTLTTLGLAVVGCPVPLALGILAGLLTFVPVVGFIISFVPTVLIALSESPQVALYAIIVFLIVQQLEEQLVLPLAQKWAAKLPPALGLIALAASGALFGLPGLIFGCPLTVVIMCLVKKLYLENGLERKARSSAEN